VEPDRLRIWKYYLISRVFGFTFGLKLLEKGEEGAQDSYGSLRETIPEADAIAKNESEHEMALLELLDEERLRYTGSMVLGLNDALMEMTGVTFAVAAVSFLIGYTMRAFLGVNV
jgi:VIT1/CCC1 family predicted Fe2+/Mn2+ transporter